ncbi:MAG TPA: hypothetical protein VF128_02760 [Gemmatimonadaceae bacterium]
MKIPWATLGRGREDRCDPSRKYAEHGDWMIRAYAIGMGAGTQVLAHLPWFISRM